MSEKGSGEGAMKRAPKNSSCSPVSLSVVVVDDSEDCAEMLAELLRFHGHDVRVANLGSDALDLLAQVRPDVVLLDVSLPDLDGYEVAATIRARFGGTVRLVALTGYSTVEARVQATAAGFDAFITKPCTSVDLESALVP